MQESIDKIKGAAAIIQNMVSTDEEVVYNDLALFFTAKLLYEAIDELEEFLDNNQFGLQSALQLRGFIYKKKLEQLKGKI